jgi:hypothetical protein
MRNLFMILLCFMAMAIWTSCRIAILEITSPTEDQTLITAPFDLQVDHMGCGTIDPATFKAWLDKGQPSEREITSYFIHESGIWKAEQFKLPEGVHTFNAEVEIEPEDSFCQVLSQKAFRQFRVKTVEECLVVSPALVDFENIELHTVSKPRFVAIQNQTDKDIKIKISPPGNEYFEVIFNNEESPINSCKKPVFDLPANGRCTLPIIFKPKKAGEQTGTFVVTGENDEMDLTIEVTVKGMGIVVSS